ncbi:galactose-1-phosphate uridylyltransferase [Methyloligella solikamskensis]|uniref:Galactose-1-phosphate uridylyltransferase n=1 Tax=Methyloligella solikamskensis TaxID=1177756 RepID=A0ABW3JC17_9HYPH
MSEIRQDPCTGQRVLIASGRKHRPMDWRGEDETPLPAFDPDCPFCPGNEDKLPSIIAEVARDETPGWAVRVVPNKYPAVSASSEAGAQSAAYGEHRVIVETPRHDLDLDRVTPEQAELVVGAYHDQFCELAAKPGTKSVVLFRNFGPTAGASRQHAHTQIMSLDAVPPKTDATSRWLRAAFERHGENATARYLRNELEDGTRIIEGTEDFVLLVPFAASGPFELLILPRRHQASFAEATAPERAALAAMLQSALRRLKTVIGPLDYNWVFETSLPHDAEPELQYWCLRIAPRLSTPGGFELGTYLPVNSSSPEDDAAALRDAAGS